MLGFKICQLGGDLFLLLGPLAPGVGLLVLPIESLVLECLTMGVEFCPQGVGLIGGRFDLRMAFRLPSFPLTLLLGQRILPPLDVG